MRKNSESIHYSFDIIVITNDKNTYQSKYYYDRDKKTFWLLRVVVTFKEEF